MTLTIIVAIVAFLAVTLVLVGLLLYAKAKLTSSGDVTIDINDGEKVLTTESGAPLLHKRVDAVLTVPETEAMLLPQLGVIPLQLLSYYTALERGCDIDKPRNLAKSVTVE